MKLYLRRHMIEFTFGRLCELLNAGFRFLPFLNRISAEKGSKSVISPRLRTEPFSRFGSGPFQLSQYCWIKMHQVHWYGHEYHQKPFQGQLWLLKVFFRYWISSLTEKNELHVTDKTRTVYQSHLTKPNQCYGQPCQRCYTNNEVKRSYS